jgi:hypothetical protein
VHFVRLQFFWLVVNKVWSTIKTIWYWMDNKEQTFNTPNVEMLHLPLDSCWKVGMLLLAGHSAYLEEISNN